jgi:hypothetical protein
MAGTQCTYQRGRQAVLWLLHQSIDMGQQQGHLRRERGGGRGRGLKVGEAAEQKEGEGERGGQFNGLTFNKGESTLDYVVLEYID